MRILDLTPKKTCAGSHKFSPSILTISGMKTISLKIQRNPLEVKTFAK